MEQDEVFIEELNTNDVPEAELAQFQVVEVVEVIAPDGAPGEDMTTETEEQEAAHIQRFVCGGEKELPDRYTKLEPDELEEDTVDTKAGIKRECDAEQPSTSRAAGGKRQRVPSPSASDEETIMSDDDERTAKTTKGQHRRRPVLSPALQGLMGEANLSYARGNVEIAEKICLEIIRQNPFAPDPFVTLAEIYESRDKEKYLKMLTIVAHLIPHDRDQWIRIAEMHIAQGNLQQARVYYSKAIKRLPRDFDLRYRKAQLLERMGETYSAKSTSLKMIPHVPIEQSTLCLSTAQDVARYFHSNEKPLLALEAMESAYGVCAELFTLEEINLYIELLMLNKSYAQVVRVLLQRTSLQLETDDDDWQAIFYCVIPDDFVADFRAKLCVCLIHLHAQNLFTYLIETVHKNMPAAGQERLDLYIDITEAFMQEHHYAEAIDLLQPITGGGAHAPKSETLAECPSLVWLRHAECLRHLDRTNEAIESFMRVVELSPYCYEAKLTLSTLLKQQGRNLEAARALEQPQDDDGGSGEGGEPLNARLLYERCLMLYDIGQLEEFFDVGYMLLARGSLELRSREELMTLAGGGNAYNAECLKTILQMRTVTEETDTTLQAYNRAALAATDLTVDDEYDLYLRLMRIACEQRKYAYTERLSFAMVTTKRFNDHRNDLERLVILACYFNDDCALAFSYLREMISRQQHNNALWNLLTLLVQKGQDLRYHRYVCRLFRRYVCPRELQLFLANYHLHSSSYKYALNVYAPLYKDTEQPLVALCIAVVFNQLAMQKRVLRKTGAAAQAVTFAHKYAELRSGATGETHFKSAAQQEINYNIGRIYHQSGALHLALAYYERALNATDPLIEANEEYIGLRQEIAFNLHLIYRANGNNDKARQYLYQYCVV